MKEYTPVLINRIVDIVTAATGDATAGRAAADTLVSAKGGQRVYIPARLPADHWLVDLLGGVAAHALSAALAVGESREKGEELDIPLGTGGSYVAQRRQRARAYYDALKSGMTDNQVASAVGVTRRSVYKAKQRLLPDSSQPRLFKD